MSATGNEENTAELAERLIKRAGSKREAIRLIKAAKVKAGNAGRKLSYREVDQRLIVNAIELEREWRKRGANPPERLKLIERQVKACWLDTGTYRNGNPRGKWDESTCPLFLLGAVPPPPETRDPAALQTAFEDAHARGDAVAPAEKRLCSLDTSEPLTFDLGTNPDAVMRRIRKHPKLELKEENSIVEYWFDPPKESGQASFWKGAQSTFAIRLAPDSWTWLHHQRPEFDLLPDLGESRNQLRRN